MTRIAAISAVLCMLTGLFTSSWVLASRELDQEEILELVKQGKIKPLTHLLEQNRARLKGHLLDVEVEHEHGRLVYEIEMLGEDGVVREFYLDPVTGRILKEEIED